MIKTSLLFVVFFSINGLAGSKLLTASTSNEQDILRLELGFDQIIDSNAVTLAFQKKSLILTVPEASLNKNLPALDAKSPYIKDLKLKNSGSKNISLEIEFSDVTAMQMKENLALESIGKALVIEILPPTMQHAQNQKESTSNLDSLSSVTAAPTASSSLGLPDKKMNQAHTEALASSKTTTTTTASSSVNQEESKIPLFENKTEPSRSGQSEVTKIGLMVIGLIVLGGGCIFFLKNKSKMVNGPESLMKIKMITQFHIGPKKSLAVIRVAGESLLLSITETQITLIKSLVLLDEDLPEVTPSDFAESLDDENKSSSHRAKESYFANETTSTEEEFSFGPATKTTLTQKIPLLRKII